MRIYDAEVKDGLGERISAGGRLSYASLATKADNPAPFGYCPDCGKAGQTCAGDMATCAEGHEYLASTAKRLPARIAHANLPNRATATNLGQPDLYYLSTILVSTGLNKNDDYFDRWETWRGRASAEDKQFNYEHDARDIIGHITGCQVGILSTGTEPAFEPFDGDEPPEAFEIKTDAVLYSEWPEHADLQKRIDKVIAEINDPPETGGWYVSMEVLFKGFDYLLIPKEGDGYALAKARIVDRTDKTAFLTKHLRAFGGTGVYQDQRVARVLRDLVFSGKGLVKNPANPDSVIFTPATARTKITTVFDASGYSLNSEDVKSATATVTETVNVEEVEKLKKQVAEVTEALEKAKADNKALADDMADAKKDAKEKDDKAKEAEEKKKEAEAKADKVEAKLKLITRAGKVKAAYGFSTDEEALARAELLNELSDEKFDKVVAAGAADYEATKKKMYEQATKLGESKVSTLPAPMSGEPKKVGDGAGILPAGHTPPNNTVNTTTYAAAVAGAVVDAQPSLAVAGTNTGFDYAKAGAEIAAYFDEPEEEEVVTKKPRKSKK